MLSDEIADYLGLRRLIKPNQYTMKYNYSEVRLIFYCLLNLTFRDFFFGDFTDSSFFQCRFNAESLYINS